MSVSGLVIHPMGEAALLAEVESLDAVLALHAGLDASRPAGVVELVPAARTVLVRVDSARLPLVTARAWIERVSTDAVAPTPADSTEVVLDVVYDGADLGETAELLGLSAEALVAAHTGAHWRVAFTGFAPGFGYLVSPDWPYDVPRLPSPRSRVPAGAVGLAAGFSGAYPRETPGGWRLIGRTAARLFDPTADAASSVLLAPGASVRFQAVRELPLRVPDLSPDRAAPPISAETDPGFRNGTENGPVDAALPEPTAPVPEPTAPVPEPAAPVPEPAAPVPEPAAPVPEPVEGPHPSSTPPRRLDKLGDPKDRTIRITDPGLFSSVQDLGRPRRAALGVARSGALDRAALRIANRLVGNPEAAAAIEVAMGRWSAVASADTWFALTGAWGSATLDGRPVDPDIAHPWPAAAELRLDWFAHGARAYVAVRGGIDVSPAVGSRSTDTMAGLGPAPLRQGDELALAPEPQAPIPVIDLAPWGAPPDDLELALAPGPRADWFAASALSTLFESTWTVSAQADRVGIRLDGPELERARSGELASEGMVPGALQVPPSGRPTILLADGPVTGGYPVIAVVTDAALDLLGQARPGTRIRFRHAR